MKVWLNDLKEGDIFYHIMFYHVYKCKHLGDANNINFRMSRIKYEVLDEDNILLKDILGVEHEEFVNKYVYDDYESAVEALREQLQQDLDITFKSIFMHKQELDNLEKEAKRIKELIKKYAKQDLEKNITKS